MGSSPVFGIFFILSHSILMSLRLFKRFIVYHPMRFLYKNLALHPFLALRAGDKKIRTPVGISTGVK
ncbi:MAG TPA: hypothetical protein DDZ40_02830 [Deltaproteobacteria bacterium]|nr:hypothetical protein [Deltaproteobacteria bacterium]